MKMITLISVADKNKALRVLKDTIGVTTQYSKFILQSLPRYNAYVDEKTLRVFDKNNIYYKMMA